VPKNPANEWVLAKAAELGRDYDESNVAYYTSRSLLRDVLHAAGAIEYTVHRIEAAAAAIQSYAQQHELRVSADSVPMSLGSPQVDDAFTEYANLLNWLRTLNDRMRSSDPYSDAKLGLVPALSEEMPLRGEVETVFDRFTRDPVIENEALLTNFGLHLHALPGGGTPFATMTSDGGARLLIPDKPTKRLYLFDQFTYDDEREMVAFGLAVLDRVASFVDGLLSAFEVGTTHAMAQRAERSQQASGTPGGTELDPA
jgi:hypothetical protein